MHFTEEEKEQIAQENLKLIYYVLKKMHLFYRRDELYDVGLQGLVKGINTYDKSKGFALSSYLYKCIYNEIGHVLRIENLPKRKGKTISINTKINEDGTELEELLGYDPKLDDELINQEMLERIYKRIALLPEKQQKVFYYYFGLKGYPKLTQKEIGTVIGCKVSNVSIIYRRIIRKLKYELRDYKN